MCLHIISIFYNGSSVILKYSLYAICMHASTRMHFSLCIMASASEICNVIMFKYPSFVRFGLSLLVCACARTCVITGPWALV
jgi:hypothetical protein